MKKVFVINSKYFGNGNDALGSKLMGAFLRKLWARQDKPDILIFYNSGVELLAKDSMVLDALIGLEEAGVELVACGTCIDDYGLRNDIKTGRISNMEEIVSIMMSSDSVITI